MTVENLIQHESPSPGLEVAVGAVSESVKEFTSALLARVGADSAMLGRGPELLAMGKVLQAKFQEMTIVVLPIVRRDHEAQRFVIHSLTELIEMADELLSTMDEIEIRYQASSRSTRRAQARRMALTNKIAEVLTKLRDMMIDFLELIDPTPAGYLEDEVRKIHGDCANSMISSFKGLATSESFTLEAFKQRHDLK